ncbi:hypothetical protein [Bacteroides sp. 519]|uniref:hypothetical protein n=1 Tax=Bacteroides sp. 519 TaxID=2302937 RepID=UPI0013D599A0|nr:hypothetical protein [Bacteroides sp. 519]
MDIRKEVSIKRKLINIFLLEMPRNIVDISYEYNDVSLNIQIVLLDKTDLDKTYENILREEFDHFVVNVTILYIAKDAFNKNIGEWLPSEYNWLSNVLYSKAEII